MKTTFAAAAALIGLAVSAAPAAAQSMYEDGQMQGRMMQRGMTYERNAPMAAPAYGYGYGSAQGVGNGYVYNPSTEAAVEFQDSFNRDPGTQGRN